MLIVVVVALIGALFLPRLLPYIALVRRHLSFAAKLPGPTALPLVGNALDIAGDSGENVGKFLHEKAREMRAKGHNMMRLWIGSRLWVVPLDGAAAKNILDSTEEITKGADYDFLIPWLGTGLINSTNQKWHSRRRMLTPIFSKPMFDGYVEKMDRHAKILVEILDGVVDKEIEIKQYLKRAAVDIICETAMSKELDSQHNITHPYVRAVDEINGIAMIYSLSPWLWVKPIFYATGYGRRFDAALHTLNSFTNEVITERTRAHDAGELVFEDEDHQGKRAFLDMLLEMKKENALTPEDIREEVDTFLFGGHDTTATTMGWTIWCLATNPEFQQKAYEEVHALFGDSDRSCTVADITKLAYLDRCIKEALRVYPSAPTLQRQLQNDFQLGEYTIPKGADIIIAPWVLHHNEQVYSDDWKFDPDRFLPEEANKRHAFDYIPFSAGLRNCIGQKFAIYEAKLIISWLLRRFSFHTERQQLSNACCPEVVLRPKLGIPVTLRRR